MAIPDWNQTDSKKADYIKNKPTILTEDDVRGLIEGNTDDTVQVQANWTQDDDTQVDYIKNKPTIIDKFSEDENGELLYDGSAIGGLDSGYAEQIEANTKVRHTHADNLEVLNKFSEVDGVIFYNGQQLTGSEDGGITQETDPTVPDWAKAENPPTASEISYSHPDYDTIYGEIDVLLNDLEKFYDTWKETLPGIDGLKHTHKNKETLDNIDTLFVRKENMPTIPNWALQDAKPTYTASEISYDENNSVADMISAIPSWALETDRPSYTASDVGALPDTTVIPSSDEIKAEVLAYILDTVPNAEGGSY
jgi:hypothetical protein